MLPSVSAKPKTGELLAFRHAHTSSYSQYASAHAWLQRIAFHPVLGFAGGFLLLIILLSAFGVLRPSVVQAQVQTCVDAGRLPGVQSACSSGTVTFPAVIVNSSSPTDPLAPFVNASCTSGQSCAVATGNELCAALARIAGKGVYTCAAGSACPQGRAGLEVQLQPAGGACGSGQVCCIVPPSAAPAAPAPARQLTLDDPLGGVSLPELIGNIVRTFAGIAGALALLMFVYGGVMWILSGGEQKKVADAQVILRNATIGLILIFGAYFFTAAIIGAILAKG